MAAGPGKVRFTIDISADEWVERGEFSRDEETWVAFLEMTLKRVRD
jgi:hypothetical protein